MRYTVWWSYESVCLEHVYYNSLLLKIDFNNVLNSYIYIYAFSRRFYPKRLTVHSGYNFFFYQYVFHLWSEPMTFCAANAMLTTEPQEHLLL